MKTRIKYWLQDEAVQNFGDAISSYLASQLFLEFDEDGPNVHIIGSVIDDGFVMPPRVDDDGQEINEPRVTFWGCGIRQPGCLDRQNFSKVELLAVRGPVSASELRLGASAIIGDPAFLLPALYEPRVVQRFEGKRVCVPHFHEKRTDFELLHISGCDLVLRPNIRSGDDAICQFVDTLFSASFVLTASLHAAIVAAAYDRPFAFWSNGCLDLPTKWADTASLIDIPLEICTTVSEGEAYYTEKVVPRFCRPAAWQLLLQAPFPVRPDALLKILQYEVQSKNHDIPNVLNTFIDLFSRHGDHFSKLASNFNERKSRQSRSQQQRLEKERSKAGILNDQVRALQAKIGEIEPKITETRVARELLEATLKAEQERSELLASEGNAAAAKLELLEAKIERLESSLTEACADQGRLEVTLKAEQERSELLACEKSATVAELKVLEAKVGRLESNLTETQEDRERLVATLKAEIDLLGQRTSKVTETNKELVAQAIHAGSKVVEVQAKWQRLDAERTELSARTGELIRASATKRAGSARVRLHRLVGHRRRHTHEKILAEARLVDEFLSGIEWSKIGAPIPEGRLDRVICHLAYRNVGLIDLPIFDANLYLALNPDVAATGISAIVHYIQYGRHEGRNFHPIVDTAYYQQHHPDAAALGMSAIEHYVKIGAEKGYNPHPLFDTKWYLRRYPDVAARQLNPLAHYLGSPKCQPHPLFDTNYYWKTYPDVISEGIDPLTHFITFGGKEGRNPNPIFDSSFYFENNPDVPRSGMNPLIHYIERGAGERRDPHPDFNTAYYLATYPDVAKAGLNPLTHYLTVGRNEGRNGLASAPLDFFQPRVAVLMIDALYPRPDEDSGSLDQISYIKIFQNIGYKVYFAAAVEFGSDPTLAGPVENAGATCINLSDYGSIEQFIRERAREFAVFFFSRVHFGAQFINVARMYSPEAKILFNTVDLHHLREQRQAEATGDMDLLRASEEVKTLELNVASTADATIVVSRQEEDLLIKELPGARIFMVPLVRDYGLAPVAPFIEREGIAFIGGFQHRPNVDAVEHLLNDIWPAVLRRNPHLKLYVIGSHMPAAMAEREEPNVSFVGFVPKLDFWLNTLKMTVAPLRYGAGAKGKVVTSLSHGLPCVATPVASEGMGLTEGRDILVSRSTEEMAEHIVTLHASEKLWKRLSDSGLAVMRADYSLDSGVAKVRALLDSMGVKMPT